MIAYKVVIARAGLFCSWTWMGRDTGITYEIGTVVEQPKDCGPLACFKQLTDACSFITRFGSVNRTQFEYPELILRVEVIERSPESRLWVHDEVSDLPLPEGTILVSKLRVLSAVEPRFTRFTFREQWRMYQEDYCQLPEGGGK